MDATTIVAAYICGVLMTISPTQGEGWRGIVPLHSTRQDVERLIGSPMMPEGITYDLKTERVNVGYSHGGCGKGEEWNVTPGTVTNIRIYPQTKVILSDLQVDLNSVTRSFGPRQTRSSLLKPEVAHRQAALKLDLLDIARMPCGSFV